MLSFFVESERIEKIYIVQSLGVVRVLITWAFIGLTTPVRLHCIFSSLIVTYKVVKQTAHNGAGSSRCLRLYDGDDDDDAL